MNTFYIYCEGGLGNRLGALFAGIAVARALGGCPTLIWNVRHRWFEAAFTALFSAPAYQVVENRIGYGHSNHAGTLTEQTAPGPFAIVAPGQEGFNDDYVAPRMSVFLNENEARLSDVAELLERLPVIYSNYTLTGMVSAEAQTSIPKIRPEIVDEASSYAARIKSQGVEYAAHFRDSDACYDRWHSFVQFLQGHDGPVAWFSDSNYRTEMAVSTYGSRIHTRACSRPICFDSADDVWPDLKMCVRSLDCLIDAMIDLLAMSRFQIVFGSMGSTFASISRHTGKCFPDLASLSGA